MEDAQLFTVEELEARFEMESLAGGGGDVAPDWSCKCEFNSK